MPKVLTQIERETWGEACFEHAQGDAGHDESWKVECRGLHDPNHLRKRRKSTIEKTPYRDRRRYAPADHDAADPFARRIELGDEHSRHLACYLLMCLRIGSVGRME